MAVAVRDLEAALDLDELVEDALAAHRDELLELIRQRVGAAVDEFVLEILVTSTNGNGSAPRGAAGTSTSSTKRCTGCGEQLPLDAFYRDRHAADGRRFKCKRCVAEHDAERRARAQEVDASPFAGAQSTTSLEATAPST